MNPKPISSFHALLAPFNPDKRTLEVLDILQEVENKTIKIYYSKEEKKVQKNLELFKLPIYYLADLIIKKSKEPNFGLKNSSPNGAIDAVMEIVESDIFKTFITSYIAGITKHVSFYDTFLNRYLLELYRSNLREDEKVTIGNMIRQVSYRLLLQTSSLLDKNFDLRLKFIETENRILHHHGDKLLAIPNNYEGQAKRYDISESFEFWPFHFATLQFLKNKLYPNYIDSDESFFAFFKREPIRNEKLIVWKSSLRSLAYLFFLIYQEDRYKSLQISEFICRRFRLKNSSIDLLRFRSCVSQVRKLKERELSAELKNITRLANEIQTYMNKIETKSKFSSDLD